MRVIYLTKCKQLNLVPKASIVTRRRNDEFDLKHFGAGDATVQALAPSVHNMKTLQKMDLRDNRMAELGASEMMDAVRNNVALHTIDLSTNRIGKLGIEALSRTIHTLLSLRSLDLTHNKLTDSEIVVLMSSIPDAINLANLNLSNNSIASVGAEAIGHALNQCPNLCSLDLSWNAIRGKGAAAIGLALASNSVLTNLNLAWNGLGGSKYFDLWADALELNTGLLSMDLSHNGLDERNCLIICENLKLNTVITKLVINDNPLGPIGAKLVFKLMDMFGEDRQLLFEKCNFDAKSKQCDFNPSECTGTSFELEMSEPYDRSVALALVRIAGKNIVDQWRTPKLDRSAIDVAKYLGRGDLLPRLGTLEFTYVQFVRKATKDNVMNVSTFNKLTAMIAAPDRSEVDRLAQVQTLAEEIDLTCLQLAKMIDEAKPSSRGKITLILNLFSRIVDREEFYEIEERLTTEEIARLRLDLGPMWSYSDDNPTGHYKLNLESNFDRELASKVLSVNNFERQIRKDNNLADTSDDGYIHICIYVYVYTCVCIYIYIYIWVYIYVCILYTYRYFPICIHVYTYIYKCTYVLSVKSAKTPISPTTISPTRTTTGIYIYVYAYMHIYMYTYTSVSMCSCIYICVGIYIYTHTHTHTQVHTCINMYIHTCIGTT